MAEYEPSETLIKADTLVVGGGIAGMTTSIETAEACKHVILVERQASIGGRVAAMYQYFPKLCPPTCGVEINLKRIKNSPYVRVLTLAEVEKISGTPGDYEVQIKLHPRYVNEKCTACGECEKVCEIERQDDFNYGMSKTKAIYMPHLMAYPARYVVDPKHAGEAAMQKCVEACPYGAIDLKMEPRTITAKVGGIVWATGWSPYDATKLENLGFGQYRNVITNVMMERLAAPNGPTNGKILRPSDSQVPKRIGFVQCAGSRDEKHLPYCSAVCCLASMKQAAYIRAQHPDAEVHVFYIDVRSPGRYEDFYVKAQGDAKLHFHRGKVAKIEENPQTGSLILESENTLAGQIMRTEVDMAVLAVGMVPNTSTVKPPLATEIDDYGFIVSGCEGVVGAGTVVRPMDVASCVQDATGAALKAINQKARR